MSNDGHICWCDECGKRFDEINAARSADTGDAERAERESAINILSLTKEIRAWIEDADSGPEDFMFLDGLTDILERYEFVAAIRQYDTSEEAARTAAAWVPISGVE